MEIQEIAGNIFYENGIWFSKDKREISYPSEGNMNCAQIETDSFWFKHRNNCITTAVKKHSPNDIFFDIGGGNGYVSKGLEENGIQTVLIEPGIHGALNAKNNELKNIICSTFEDAGIKENSCKAIGLFDVVEHIKDDKEFLKSIAKILNVGGLVYITVPAYNVLWSNEDDDAGHFRRYTRNSMKKTLEEAGFDITYSTYIFSILPIPVFIFRTIPSLLKMNKKSNDLNKHKKEHSNKKGFLNLILDKIWGKEIDFIKHNKIVPFGGSCFIVAKKR